MYQVLARKWRPQGFDDLVGQKHVSKTLTNAIAADRLAHAYIFAGLRGTGKTTVARILAKCVNCEKGPGTAPCGACASCEEISQSRSMDVLEIDAASRTKVEQTRELLEMVSYAPARDRFKILIIDEAHMLSKASFNALLKTLEEPPPNVLFILATTEIQKVLPTILSRCQIFEFRRVGTRELTEHLRKICDTEKIGVSDAALERIARAGEGSVRDSLSVLERAIAFCGDRIDDDEILRMLGGVRFEVIATLVGAVARRDAAAMLGVLDGLIDEGHDLLHFWNEVLAALRDLLLIDAVPDRKDLLSRSTEEAGALETAAEGLSREDLTRAFQILADLEPALKVSGQPRFMFEAALIRLASLGAVRPIEEVLRTLGGDLQGRPQKKNPAEPAKLKAPAPPAPAPPPAPAAAAAAHGGSLGDRLLASVLAVKPMIGTILEQAAGLKLDEGELVIELTAGQEHLARPLERLDCAKLLKEHAEQLAGGSVKVRIDLGAEPERPTKTPRAKAATEPHGAPSPAPAKPAKAASRSRAEEGGLLEAARQEPGVQKLLREFGAQVVAIKPFAEPRELRQTGPEEHGPAKETP